MKFFITVSASLLSILQTFAFVYPINQRPRAVASCFMAETIKEIEDVKRANSKDSQGSDKAMAYVEPGNLELSALDSQQIKQKLLDLLPRMTGSPEEFRLVENYVNALEDRYTPVQTLGFLNLAMIGEWQLLFSTNLSTGPKPNFRLREMLQKIESKDNSFKGTVANQVTWELAEDGLNFDASGTFTVLSNYEITQGARLVLTLEDSILRLAKGSELPTDVENLVGLLNRAMPKEMFDPDEHAFDTTFLDGDLRIVRMTGPRFEGVRDIFIRRGSMEINPLKQE